MEEVGAVVSGPATDKQWDYLLALKDRLGDTDFYDAVALVTGKRSTLGLTKEQASRIIDEVKKGDS